MINWLCKKDNLPLIVGNLIGPFHILHNDDIDADVYTTCKYDWRINGLVQDCYMHKYVNLNSLRPSDAYMLR